MRTNDILLDGFNDIRTLQRYLYMSDEHYIEICSKYFCCKENGNY